MKLIGAIVLAFLVGCSGSGEIEQSTTIENDSERAKFIEGLNANEIPYRIADDGSIWHRISDSERVMRVKREVYPELKYLGSTIRFREEHRASAEQFMELLRKQKVPFETIAKNGEIVLGFENGSFGQAKRIFENRSSWQVANENQP